MGELFENMEKMDIQAEWRNTALEKERADEEKKRACLAEENSIKLLVELSQEFGASMDTAAQSLMEKRSLSQEEALKKARLYRKSSHFS